MGFSQQLRSSLSAHLGPHATAELEKACATDFGNIPQDFAALNREFLALRADLEKAILRIEHLERASQTEKKK